MKTSKYLLTADNYEVIHYTNQWIVQSIKAGNMRSRAYFTVRFHEFSNTELPVKLQRTSFRGFMALDI